MAEKRIGREQKWHSSIEEEPKEEEKERRQ